RDRAVDRVGHRARPGDPPHRVGHDALAAPADDPMTALASMQGVLAQTSNPDNVIDWFRDRVGRDGSGAIPDQLWVTLWHSLVAAAVAVLVALPIATVLAHYRKAEVLSGWIVNLGRVIPTVAVLGMATLVSIRNGYGFE